MKTLDQTTHMRILDQAVANLKRSIDNQIFSTNGSECEADLGNGKKGFGVIYYNGKEVAFSRWTLQSGGVLGSHEHPELQVLAIISGKIAIYIGESYINEKPSVILNVDDVYVIKKNVQHMIVVLETTDLASMSMPSVIYPKYNERLGCE